jgi:hypothetical protein
LNLTGAVGTGDRTVGRPKVNADREFARMGSWRMHSVSLQVAAEDRINWFAFSLKIIALRPQRFIQTAARALESATAEESRII